MKWTHDVAIAIVETARNSDDDHYDDDDDDNNTFFIAKSYFSFRYYNYVKW